MNNKATWTVWVGGVEVNNYLLTQAQAEELAQAWRNDGYDDAVAENTEDD